MIRKATINDKDILNKLVTEFVKYEADNFDENNRNDFILTSYVDRRIDNEDFMVYVAEEDNKIVGFTIAEYLKGNIVKKTVEVKIDIVSVNKDYRCKGIGTSLVNQIVNDCKKNGVKYLRMDNFVNNKEANDLYEKLGFDILVVERRKKLD
ncbi:MAG: GNAT family N-acetyltransferase [Bacilli bacterium]|nr:GNAT family N-acetyltransferase [Bacilli bacterium]